MMPSHSVTNLLDELRREFGVTVVMATHSDEAAGRCDQRVLLSDGRIEQAGGA